MQCIIFFFNDTATTEIYTLSLHDALPISPHVRCKPGQPQELPRKLQSVPNLTTRAIRLDKRRIDRVRTARNHTSIDRKSTRLNSSHQIISYAVFCLKKNTPTHCICRRLPS